MDCGKTFGSCVCSRAVGKVSASATRDLRVCSVKDEAKEFMQWARFARLRSVSTDGLPWAMQKSPIRTLSHVMSLTKVPVFESTTLNRAATNRVFSYSANYTNFSQRKNEIRQIQGRRRRT